MDGSQVQMLDQDKDKDKDKQPSVSGPQSNLGTGAQSVTPVGQPTPGTGVAQPQQIKPGSKGTGFVGVRRLLGASAGSRLGQQVGGRVQQAGEQARAGIAGARQEFQQKAGRAGEQMQQQAGVAKEAVSGILGGTSRAVRPEYTGSLKDKYDAVYKRMRDDRARTPEQQEIEDAADKNKFLQSLTPEEKQQYEAAQTPSFTPTAEQQAAFQQIATGQYTGPKELAGAEQLASKAYEAQQLGKLAGTTAGRQELLQQQFGQRGGYGSKLSALDALILGKTGSRQLAEAKAGTTGLEKQLTTGQMAAAEQAKALQAQATGLGRDVLGEIERGAAGLKSAAQERFEGKGGFKEQLTKDEDKIKEGLEKGEIDEEMAKRLGLKEGQFLGTYSQNEIADLLKRASEPTLASSISKEEYARMKALEKLGGGVAQSKLSSLVSPFKEEEAGKYDPTKAIEFGESTEKGRSKFDVEQEKRKSRYESDLGTAQRDLDLAALKRAEVINWINREAQGDIERARSLDPHKRLVDEQGRFILGKGSSPLYGKEFQTSEDGTLGLLLDRFAREEAEARSRVSAAQSKLGKRLKFKKAEPK